jgi:class 3 adenylate cyclase
MMPADANDSFAMAPVADAASQMARLVKIKSVGDLVLIAGLPGRKSRHVDAYTVAAAIGLVRDIAAGVNAAGARVQCRAGVHVGPVVGCVLGYERLTFDVLGDTVNTASRLMSTTDAGEVALSDSAMEHTTKAMPGRAPLSAKRAIRSMKGKGDMVAHVADIATIPHDL